MALYEAELSENTGQEQGNDPSASSQKFVRLAQQDAYVVGPHAKYPPGVYSAYVRLRVPDASETAPLVDITAERVLPDATTEILSRRVLSPLDLKDNDWKYVGLPKFLFDPEHDFLNVRVKRLAMWAYKWIDSRQTGGPDYAWEEISTTGEALGLTDDSEVTRSLSFGFPFYGQVATQIKIGSNGIIGLNMASDYTGYLNYCLPAPYLNAFIAPFWDDLNPGDPPFGGGQVYFQDFGDHAVIQWQGVPHFGLEGSLTFQVALYADGRVLFRYKEMLGAYGDGNSATIGVENWDGSDYCQVSCNQPFVQNQLAVLVAPEWVDVDILGIFPTFHGESVRTVEALDKTVSGAVPDGGVLTVEVPLPPDVFISGYVAGLVVSSQGGPLNDAGLEAMVTTRVNGAWRNTLPKWGCPMPAPYRVGQAPLMVSTPLCSMSPSATGAAISGMRPRSG